MPQSLSATPPIAPPSLPVKQPEWAAALTDIQHRAGANRRASERSRRAQARQHALVRS
jgi:hypothetical protein